MANPTSFLPDRLADHIHVEDNGCWRWTRSLAGGYGRILWDGHTRAIHRIVWELSGRPLIDGLVLDHLCRNRACCNPDHIRQVTQAENLMAEGSLSAAKISAAATHCKRGHEFTPANVIPDRGVHRKCRECRRAFDRERNRTRRLARKAG